MSVLKLKRKTVGQAQLLIVMGLGLAMITSSMYVLEYTQKTKAKQVRGNWQSEMRGAIETAIKHASGLYRTESSCDPVVLANKLGHMREDGTVDMTTPSRSQLKVNLNDRSYIVSFGKVSRIAWDTSDPNVAAYPSANLGTDPSRPYVQNVSQQDAIVEVWTHRPGTTFLMLQQAVLINNCSYPCSTPDSEVCTVPSNRAVAYSSVTNASNYPISGFNTSCSGGRALGAIRSYSPAPSTYGYDTRDLIILKNYLRSGDLQGTSQALMVGTSSCADFNRDGLVNESDLSIMEKVLRGYLYWPTVRNFTN